MEIRIARQGMRHGRPDRVRLLAAVFLPAVLAVGMLAQTPAPSVDPAKLPARDEHQGLLIAADPYLTSERSEKEFGKKHPYSAGILAVEVYLRNSSNDRIAVSKSTMAMEVVPPEGRRQKIECLTTEEAAMRIVFPKPINPTVTRVPLPPNHGVVRKNKDVQKMEKELAPRVLGDFVEPHQTIHGFVFFDVAYQFDWATRGTLYVPDVRRIGTDEKLLFFELDLKSPGN